MTDKITLNRAVVEQVMETLAKQPCDAKYEPDCGVCTAEEALRAALESEPYTKNWPMRDLFFGFTACAYSSRMHFGKKPAVSESNRLTPLYTAPQPAAWVELSDEDKAEIGRQAGITEDDDGYIVGQLFRLTEAKLKEKNGGVKWPEDAPRPTTKAGEHVR